MASGDPQMKRLYWLARLLWPDLADISYDNLTGYVICFNNRYGNPYPQIVIGGKNGDWGHVWLWLVDQVKFRKLDMLARVLA